MRDKTPIRFGGVDTDPENGHTPRGGSESPKAMSGDDLASQLRQVAERLGSARSGIECGWIGRHWFHFELFPAKRGKVNYEMQGEIEWPE